jgi:hypothetical protein
VNLSVFDQLQESRFAYAAHADAVEKLVGEIVSAGGRSISALGDVGAPSVVKAIVARIEKELGPVTTLVSRRALHF